MISTYYSKEFLHLRHGHNYASPNLCVCTDSHIYHDGRNASRPTKSALCGAFDVHLFAYIVHNHIFHPGILLFCIPLQHRSRRKHHRKWNPTHLCVQSML